ncbi:MAG: cell division protein ZapD [Gammaproteobacteria bacterium]
MNTQIIYEFPLNERIRMFMRLELLFQQLEHFLSGTTTWDKRAAVDTLLDIMTIFSRNDIKSEVLKELDRHANILNHLANSQGVNKTKLQAILEEMNGLSKKLYANSGKTGLNVMKNDFLQSIAQRSSIPGGSCSFDLPVYHYWLEQHADLHDDGFEHWTQPFAALRKAIDIILNSIRNSTDPAEKVAQAGFFQLALESSYSYQLLRVSLDRDLACYAEISGGKHRFSIRFMTPATDTGRALQSPNDILFKLSCCIF